MACEYIYKGTTYSSKEEFISKVIPTLQNSTLSKFDKVPTNKQVYLSSIKNYEDNIVNFEKAIQAIKDNNYKIILPNNAGRYVASVESKGIRAGTIPIAENPYSKEAKEGKFDKEYALSYLKERIEIEKGSIENENRKIKEIEKVENDIYNKNISSNQFLQLLNKDNNWVTFFVKSIIQDSAKKGYEKVLFPTGNTAAKVEGHTTLEEFKKQKEDRILVLSGIPYGFTYDKRNYEFKNGVYFRQSRESAYDGDYISKEEYISLFNKSENKKDRDNEINQLRQELERVEREGFGALKPIYNFYENTVTNILKKQEYNPVLITDEYGNTWNEIKITSKAFDTILFNLKQQGYYKSIPENLLGVLSRNSIVSKVTRDLEDRWYFVRGELDQNNNVNNNIARYNQFMSMNNINKDLFIYNNTQKDQAPYLTVNSELKEEDTIIENNEKIHKEKYEAIIQFFQDKFGIKKEQIIYTNKEEFKKQFPEAYQENMQSVYSNGKFYFFTRNLTSDITIEELLHPFIYTVKELNPQLFDNLLKEAKLHYPKLNTKIQTLYANKTKSVRDQELVTQALARVFNNVYENEEPQSFLDTIKDFVSWIKEIMNELFNYFKTGKYINIPIDKLPVQISLFEIAKILNSTDTRFDIIYPKTFMYSLESDTANFNKIVENILTDQKVEAKINEILVKLPQTLKSIRNKLNNTINETEKKNIQGIIKNIEKLEDEENQNLIAFQLKGIIASVQLSNELLKNLNSMANSQYDDNIKLSYYMSVFKTAKAMDGFKELIIELKDELSTNLILDNTKDVNTFIGILDKAISSEDEISSKIRKLVKTPLLNKLVESSEYSYKPKVDEIKIKIDELEAEISKTTSQKQKDNLFNKLVPLRKELKILLEKAPTKENLEKILDGVFKDANILSHIFESKIANGNPLIATLQDIINDIYDSASRDMLQYKNEAQTLIDKYSKETGFTLRDQDKRYEQIRDIVAIPVELKTDENTKEPILDDQGNHQFDYVNQDTLLSNIDNSYITQYLELQMIKEFYFDKHKTNVANNQIDEKILTKYKIALENFQKFVDKNSEKEYTQEIYDFKSIMNEVIGDKTLREVTGNLYGQLEIEQNNLERAIDTDSIIVALDRIKNINIELKRLRTTYDENGNKKVGDDLKIAELLIKYNKLRSKYYNQSLSEGAATRYKFDLEELKKKKQQYIDSGNEAAYKNNLAKIQKEVISPDYFLALESISKELTDLNNELVDIVEKTLPQYIDKSVFKQQKKDVYTEIRELSKPYRDEDDIIDGITLLKKHPEIGLKIKDLQQYIEDLRYETSKIGSLSIAESNELSTLSKKENRDQLEQDRLTFLVSKRKDFNIFKKQNEDLLKQINNLYKQLSDLTDEYTTEYYDLAVSEQLSLYKTQPDIIQQGREFVKNNSLITIEETTYQKGGDGLEPNVWYKKQILGKKITYIPLGVEDGYSEIVDIVTSFYAKLYFQDSQWWKDNHYSAYKFDEKAKIFTKIDVPIYIWKHRSPKNPNFIKTEPSKQYNTFSVKSEYINNNFKTTYRNIPLPKKGIFENDRYKNLKKDSFVFEFLDYFTKEYLADQSIYDFKGDSVKMGHVLPAINKTSGENAVNITNKFLSFDGTFSEMFRTNAGVTDRDTSYLVGGSQSNNKTIPIRFIGKMDTKTQTKDIVAALLLFKYHTSLYKALNNTLPIFEASKLLAANVNVLEKKNYADKLSFTKKIKNIFTHSKNTKEEETRIKDIEKSVLSKSVDDLLDIFVYGQRMKPQILNLGPLGSVDLAKVSSGILGFAAKSIFIGNIISAINNSLSTRIQIIINSGIKSNLYSINNLKNAHAKAPKYTANLFSDWTKLGNKSLIGQVLDYFAFTNENPSREITSKSEFTYLKNKMEFLTSAKQMSEFEVLFIQFLTIADATPIKVNGKINKLSNIEDIFELVDGKLKIKNGVELTKEQEKRFKGKYQVLARKVTGAYRTTEISSIETNWAGKSGMFLRRYFVSLFTNRFQGTRFSFQEGDVYTGYQTEVIKNIGKLITLYKGNLPKYWNQLSDKEKVSHLKMLSEYGLLIVLIGLFRLLGGEDPKKDLKENSWAYNMQLVALLRAKSELQQFTVAGVDDLIRVGKNPFMVFQTLGNISKTISLVGPTIWGDEDAFYKQNSGLHKKGDSKLLANFLKTIGYVGVTFKPEEYIVNFRNIQNK